MNKQATLNELAYAMTERPRCFFVGGKPFFIYPCTLGMIQVCTPLIQDLSHDKEISSIDPTLELLRLCNDKKDRDKVSILLAYRCCRTPEDVYNEPQVMRRAEFFNKKMKDSDMADVLMYIISELQCDVSEIEDNLGISEERRWMRQAINSKDKDSSGSLTFNGKSIYGSFIGHFCKEYGWSFQYVVWGISYMNLKLLSDDEITSVYLSKDELRKSGVPTDRSQADMSYKDMVEKYKDAFDNAIQ